MRSTIEHLRAGKWELHCISMRWTTDPKCDLILLILLLHQCISMRLTTDLTYDFNPLILLLYQFTV